MWKLLLNTAIGIFLMAASGIFGYEETTAAANERIIGPLFATFAITAIWEATRVTKKFNLPFAVWLIVAPLILSYEPTTAIYIDIAAGIIVTVLTLLPYKPEGTYGGGWSATWKSNQLHQKMAKQQEQELKQA